MNDGTLLSNRVRAFLAAPRRFATLATSGPDGAPRQAVIWYRLDANDRITINSAEGRRWPADLRRNPRCSLVIIDPADGYSFVALDGRVVEVIDDQETAQADIAGLARAYYTDEPEEAESSIERFRAQQRVSFRVAIVAAHDHLED